jgi:hypothetical protein
MKKLAGREICKTILAEIEQDPVRVPNSDFQIGQKVQRFFCSEFFWKKLNKLASNFQKEGEGISNGWPTGRKMVEGICKKLQQDIIQYIIEKTPFQQLCSKS